MNASDGWIDMERYPNLDPDQALEPGRLDELRDTLHATPLPPLPDTSWKTLLLIGLYDPGSLDSAPPDMAGDTLIDPAASQPTWNNHPFPGWAPHTDHEPPTDHHDDHPYH